MIHAALISFYVAGFGFAMVFLASTVLVNTYFERRRGLACGIMSAGSGIGLLVLAPLLDLLRVTYAWKGAMWLSAGITMQGCALALLMRPIDNLQELKNTNQNFNDETSSQIDRVDDIANETPILDEKIDNCTQESDLLNPTVSHLKDTPSNLSQKTMRSKYYNPSVINKSTKSLFIPDILLSDQTLCRSRSEEFLTLMKNVETSRRANALSREDIFYSGSMMNLKELSSVNDIISILKGPLPNEETVNLRVTACSLFRSKFFSLLCFAASLSNLPNTSP